MSETITLRNPTVGDVIAALGAFSPDQPFLSAADVFTEIGFQQVPAAVGGHFVVMSVLVGASLAQIIEPPS